MAGLELESSDSENTSVMSQINITPFVDVVLVLLVIFIVTAPQLVKDVIDLRLPKATTGDGQKMTTLGLAVNRDGQFLLNGAMIDEEALKLAALQALKDNVDAQAIIAADSEVVYGRVVRLIDLLKSVGFEKFAVQIEREKTN